MACTGRIDATETVELRARVSGHLDSIHFQAGQLVKKGDLLFTTSKDKFPTVWLAETGERLGTFVGHTG